MEIGKQELVKVTVSNTLKYRYRQFSIYEQDGTLCKYVTFTVSNLDSF